MWDVKCTVCEEVDMTCFASFRAQTIAEVLCHVIFSRHFADDTPHLCTFLFFPLCRWHGSVFFLGGVCPTTPMSSAGAICASYFFKCILFRRVCFTRFRHILFRNWSCQFNFSPFFRSWNFSAYAFSSLPFGIWTWQLADFLFLETIKRRSKI